MKAILSGLGALIVVAAAATSVRADAPYYYASYPYLNIPQAPDACGPGYYCVGPCGMVYGPNYCLRPAGQPFNGMLPPPQGGAQRGAQGGGPNYRAHPYARGPRDFYMLD